MSDSSPIRYTSLEVSGLLPSGWNQMVPAESAAWEPRRRIWSLTVYDGAGVEWELVVLAKEIESHGRLQALRLAIDRVYRHGLG